MENNLLTLIDTAADTHGLPPGLVIAIVQVESNGRHWAMRYEPAFYGQYVKGQQHTVYAPCSRVTEEMGRATSWGLMQIMGQTARELGFKGVYLTELCDPAVGLEWGCLYLSRKVVRYQGNLEAAVAAYNAGKAKRLDNGQWANQDYVDKVRKAGGFV